MNRAFDGELIIINQEFEKEYLCYFTEPSPNYEFAFKKWLEYYYHTEVYDRQVCTGFNEKTGDALPTSTVEYIQINRNAKRLMNKIVEELRDKEINDETWKAAREDASKYSHIEAERLLIRLNNTK